MKKLGLSADEVCEIGKWKSVDAFCAHYQRLGAQEKLEENLNLALACESGVHSQTSHRGSAEPDLSRTPLSPGDRGGRDKEGEAQTLCEPAPPTQEKLQFKFKTPGPDEKDIAPRGGYPLESGKKSSKGGSQSSWGGPPPRVAANVGEAQPTPAKRRH
jgi:hypothetical protein